jgi:hypothetical protein
MSGMFLLLPQRFCFHILELVSEPCIDVVALFIKRGESLFREGIGKNLNMCIRSSASIQ